MLSSQDCDWLHGKDIQLVWKLAQQQHTHQHAHTPPERSYTIADCTQTPLQFTSDSFCWSLNASFPFGLSLSPLSLRLLMIGTSMSSACMFLSQSAHFLIRGWRIPVRWRAETAPPHQEEHRLRSSSWRSPPPPASAAAAPPVCLVHCPCSPREGGVRDSWQQRVDWQSQGQ